MTPPATPKNKIRNTEKHSGKYTEAEGVYTRWSTHTMDYYIWCGKYEAIH